MVPLEIGLAVIQAAARAKDEDGAAMVEAAHVTLRPSQPNKWFNLAAIGQFAFSWTCK